MINYNALKPSLDGHIYLSLAMRKELITEHKNQRASMEKALAETGDDEPKKKGRIKRYEDTMKLIEKALEDSEPMTDAELCANGDYEKAIEQIERKIVLYTACEQGTITITDVGARERPSKGLAQIREEITVRGRNR